MLPRVLRNRWFAGFSAAVGVVGLGHEFSKLALPLLLLDLTHAVGAVAVLRVIEFIPSLVWGPFAGAIIDRLDRRAVLLVCDAGSACSYAAMAVVTLNGLPFQLLYLLAFVASAFELTWALVTDFAVVPSLVAPAQLTEANAVYLGADRGARALGPALAGVAIATVGFPVALLATTASFAATFGAIFFMPARYRLEDAAPPFTARRFAGEVREGFAYVLRHPILRALVVLMFLANLGGPGLQTVLLYYLREEVRLEPATIGVALSILGLAGILGAFGAPTLARGRPLGQSMLGAVAVSAAAAAVAALASEWRLVVAAAAGRWFAQGAKVVYVFLPRQREIPAQLRGRANGAFRMMVVMGNTLSPAFLSAIADRAGSHAAFAAAAGLMLIATAVTLFSPLRRYDTTPVEVEPLEPAEEAEAAAD